MTEIAAAWIGVGGAGVVGLVGWVLAAVANQRAKQANRLAETANKLASEAVAEAAKANEISKHANDLSEQANAIAHAQSAKQSDPSHVEWRAEWDKEASVARLSNRGRDDAVDPSVLFKRGKVEELVRGDHRVPRDGEIAIPFPEVAEHRERHRIDAADTSARARADRIGVVTLPFGFHIQFDVRWMSELGNPGQQTVKLFVS